MFSIPNNNSSLSCAILNIDLAALGSNYTHLQSMTQANVAGVIKANGYGLGAGQVYQTLYDQGCRVFFVATPEEAATLPRYPDVSIYVLGGLYAGAEDFYIEKNIRPVLNSIEDIERWSGVAKKKSIKLPAILHIDTGMNRLGAPFDSVPVIPESIHLDYILSHFSSSDEKDHPANDRQAVRFAKIAALFPDTKKSLANSSGIFCNPAWHYDLVRPGYALYGGNPTPENPNPMKPVVSLNGRVLQTRTVKSGDFAGYNETFRFDEDTQTATVAIGYADGFPRGASNTAKFYWNGQPCPIRGRVSMDATIIEIGHLPNPPKPGDWMEILGPHQDIDALAKDCGTIGYNILTALGPRYARLYHTKADV